MGQGLFLSATLLLSRQGELRVANRLLSALVLLFTLVIAHAWLDLNGLFGPYPKLASSIATLPLLVGPLLWLYLQNLLRGQSLGPRSAWHGLPFGLALLAWAPVYLQTPVTTAELAAPGTPLPGALAAFGILKALHLGGYLLASYRLVLQTDQGQPGQALVHSLRRLTALLAWGLGLDALIFVAEALGLPVPVSSDLLGAAVLAAFVYGLAFYAMRLPVGYRPPAPEPAPEATPAQRPADDLLSAPERAQFLDKLNASMAQEHLYRDGELSLEQLATHLALTPHELSQLINRSLSMNLQEYLNGYRVRALQAAIQDPANRNASILDLALGVGFNSKSSLNRVFKSKTGMTPSQFRDTHGPAEPRAPR
jgi:AraC-like DNA-binding protein